ncbi:MULTISPECIES: hypothetical protein [Rhodococcus]|uniref:hypothetical protein n=1 Tax=Rhodococcus TaxID=1827 RepID=UPI001F2CC219|nr:MULTISPECIES: hypothetical protein [Rhodococcus]MBQ7804824.1 hypothetical protein [Rhodococcus sp. (in: high G+C Gram-positive bacteria)]
MEFPAGSMLTVLRAPEVDVHGDGDYEEIGSIGPCDSPRLPGGHQGNRQDRDTNTIPVSAPVGSDVRKSDRIKLPDGTIASITSDVEPQTNPFTGWTPFIRFTLTEVT